MQAKPIRKNTGFAKSHTMTGIIQGTDLQKSLVRTMSAHTTISSHIFSFYSPLTEDRSKKF